METIYFNGTPCHTAGTLPEVGTKAACYTFVTPELKEIHCADFHGKRVVLNVFPSLDTPVCAASVRRFNNEAKPGKYRGALRVDGFTLRRRTLL